MARVFVTRQLPGPALRRLQAIHEVSVWPGRMPPPREVLQAEAWRSDGLLTLLNDRVDARLIDSAPSLVAISNYAVGVDNIDLAAASRRGIPVGHTPDVLTDATADLAFALLLAAARKLPEAIAGAREDWITWEPRAFLGAQVYGATLGIIGFGRIGRAVARRAEGFHMKVVSTERAGDAVTGLERVLRAADFISLHCPLTPETHHLIDRDAFARMKPTTILINTARGPIIDTDALGEALRAGRIAAAALDVTDPEPLPADHQLWSAPNLLIVPHIGSATRAARERMSDLAVENLVAALDGRPMPFQANRDESAAAAG
jgi:glyoxylate reductase